MSFPPVAELVPHAGAMRLLERVVAHAPERTTCRVRSEDAALFADASGQVPGFVALEWMAQCIAVHGGLRARAVSQPPRVGMLLGTRRLQLHCDGFAPGSAWLVEATPRKEADHGMIAFACAVSDESGEQRLAEAQLNVFLVDPGTLPPSGGGEG